MTNRENMTDERIKHTITYSISEKEYEIYKFYLIKFTELIAENLSKSFGGCSVSDVIGYWSDEASETKEKYESVNKEMGVRIEVTSVAKSTEEIKETVRFCKQKINDRMKFYHPERDFPVVWVDF